ERHAVDLRYGKRDVDRVDDEIKSSKHLGFEGEKADAGIDADAPRRRSVKAHQQIGGAEVHRRSQIEVGVGKGISNNGRSISVEHSRSKRRSVIGEPRVPFGVETEGPSLVEAKTPAEGA